MTGSYYLRVAMLPVSLRPLQISDEDLSKLDRRRFFHGVALEKEEIGYGRYMVEGSGEEHYVSLYEPDVPICDCADYVLRGVVCCKHVVAACTAEKHPRFLKAAAKYLEAFNANL